MEGKAVSGITIPPSKRAAERDVAELRKFQTSTIVAAHGLKFLHLRKMTEDGLEHNGGVTVAYRRRGMPRSRKQFFDVSTAICSDRDKYCKATGRFVAASNFDTGSRIVVQLPEGSATRALEFMFGFQLIQSMKELDEMVAEAFGHE